MITEATTHRLVPEIHYYTFRPNPPALRARSGDRVVARCRVEPPRMMGCPPRSGG